MKSPNKLVGALLVSALTVGSTFPGGAFEAAFPHALPVQEVVEVAADGTLRPLEWVGSGMNYLRNSVPSGFSMSSFAIPAFASWGAAQQWVKDNPRAAAAILGASGLVAYAARRYVQSGSQQNGQAEHEGPQGQVVSSNATGNMVLPAVALATPVALALGEYAYGNGYMPSMETVRNMPSAVCSAVGDYACRASDAVMPYVAPVAEAVLERVPEQTPGVIALEGAAVAGAAGAAIYARQALAQPALPESVKNVTKQEAVERLFSFHSAIGKLIQYSEAMAPSFGNALECVKQEASDHYDVIVNAFQAVDQLYTAMQSKETTVEQARLFAAQANEAFIEAQRAFEQLKASAELEDAIVAQELCAQADQQPVVHANNEDADFAFALHMQEEFNQAEQARVPANDKGADFAFALHMQEELNQAEQQEAAPGNNEDADFAFALQMQEELNQDVQSVAPANNEGADFAFALHMQEELNQDVQPAEDTTNDVEFARILQEALQGVQQSAEDTTSDEELARILASPDQGVAVY